MNDPLFPSAAARSCAIAHPRKRGSLTVHVRIDSPMRGSEQKRRSAPVNLAGLDRAP